MRLGGIRGRLVLLAALPLVAFFVLAAFAASTFNQVRVLGENYQQIVQSKDLVADVLPPPQYIIESYLTVLQMTSADNAADTEDAIARLERLEIDFRDRRQVWDLALTNPTIRQTLLEDAYRPADQFYVIVDEEFIPLVQAGDLEAADNLANGRLRDLYLEHRAAIDRVVLQATAEEQRVENQTGDIVDSRVRVLIAAFALLVVVTVVLAFTVVRSILRPISRLREVASKDLPEMIQKVRTTSFDDDEEPEIDLIEVRGKSELDQAATAFNSVVRSAVDLVSQQARLRRNTATTFVNLGRRNQNLVARQLRFIDELEQTETDPALLKNLFRLDHLATRMRRNAESLLVLAGVETPRKWREPVALVEVVRSALGEVEGYERVRLDLFGQAMLPGTAIADVTHLLAELIENALRYSPPDSAVIISGGHLNGDYQLSIIDQGVGLPPRELAEANQRLTTVMGFDEAPTGSLGLFVVARLGARYGITVELESEGGDGLTAYVTVPRSMLEQAGDRELQAAGRGRHLARPGDSVTPSRGASLQPQPTAPTVSPLETTPRTPSITSLPESPPLPPAIEYPTETPPEAAPAVPSAPSPVAPAAVATGGIQVPVEQTATPAPGATASGTDAPAPAGPAPAGPAPGVTAAGFKKRQSKLAPAGVAAIANGHGNGHDPNGAPDAQPPGWTAETAAAPDREAEDVRNRYSSFADGKRRGSVDSTT